VAFEAQVLQQDGLITRRGFAQPFRPQCDATSGPILFQRSQYESAVRRAAADATVIE
jgi:hypothetical protein